MPLSGLVGPNAASQGCACRVRLRRHGGWRVDDVMIIGRCPRVLYCGVDCKDVLCAATVCHADSGEYFEALTP
jgi:hypothetical protein